MGPACAIPSGPKIAKNTIAIAANRISGIDISITIFGAQIPSCGVWNANLHASGCH
jgi:hypothetical protein